MLKVKDVARLFEVSDQTVRNWDIKGFIKADKVTPTGHKFYSEEQIYALYKKGINSAESTK